jgi:hypothetical protein
VWLFPCNTVKRPLVSGGVYGASCDPAVLDEWRAKWPDALWAIACGPSGVAALDIDGDEGEAWLAAKRAELPTTLEYRTRRGRHLVFRSRNGLRRSVGRVHAGVDILAGDGSSFIFWPWAGGEVLCRAEPAEFPKWLAATAGGENRRGATSVPGNAAPPVQAWPVEEQRPSARGADCGAAPLLAITNGRIPKSLYLAALKALPVPHREQRRLCGILGIAVNRRRRRNEGLFNAAVAMRDLIGAGLVAGDVAEGLLLEAARLNGYVAKDGEAAALDTIRSGLRAPA